MATDTTAPVTRAQVKSELAEAVRTGNIIDGESGKKLNEIFPYDYPAQQPVASKSREQAKGELAKAIRSGQVDAYIAG
jgi:hypothetical protein